MNGCSKGLLVVTAMALAFGLSACAEAGMVGYWSFDGNADDLSVSGNHGTLEGSPLPSFATDVPAQLGSGRSLQLTANGQGVRIPANASLNSTSFTLTYWMKNPGQTAAANRLTSRGSYSFETVVANAAGTLGGRPHGLIHYPPPSWSSAGAAPALNQWTHVAYVYDGATLRAYADGLLTSSCVVAINPSGALGIGMNVVTGGETFLGHIDDVALWNVPLPQSLLQNFAHGHATPLDATSVPTILLNSVIGPPGTDANDVKGAGNAVNHTGRALNAGATALTTLGASGPGFDFNTGFADGRNRTMSFNSTRVIADRKFNTISATPLILDLNNNGSFADELDYAPADPDTFHRGFGMHADAFVTFDLDVVRAQNNVRGWDAWLTGQAGLANVTIAGQLQRRTSAAILLDGVVLAVYDFDNGRGSDPYLGVASFDLHIPASGRYLTFIGLSGLDLEPSWDHVGFANVRLTVVPEPAGLALLAAGGLALIPLARRRRK